MTEPVKTEELDETLKKRTDGMSREQMVLAWRFAPVGSPLFQGVAGDYFEKRFKELGAFSPAISKQIGW